MKQEAKFTVLCILLLVLAIMVNLTYHTKDKNKIYVSKQELDSLAAADSLVIRACSGVGTATERDMIKGKTAWSGDELITGTMPTVDSEVVTLNAGDTYIIPEGYHDGNIQIIVNDLNDLTEGTATSKDIVEGQTAWVNGELITGTIPIHESSESMTLNPGDSYTIPEGYHTKDTVITTTALSELTEGNITADSLSAGQIAWVNGKRIVGTGKSNQDSYQQGYSQTGGKGRAYLNQVNTKMVIGSGNGASKLQGTGAGITVDVTGSNASNVLLAYRTKQMLATSSYQRFSTTIPDYSCQ